MITIKSIETSHFPSLSHPTGQVVPSKFRAAQFFQIPVDHLRLLLHCLQFNSVHDGVSTWPQQPRQQRTGDSFSGPQGPQKSRETNIWMLCDVFLDHAATIYRNFAMSFYLISFQVFDGCYIRMQSPTWNKNCLSSANFTPITRESNELRIPQDSGSFLFLEFLRCSAVDGFHGHAPVAVKLPIPRIPPSPGWLNCCRSVLLVEMFMKSCDKGSS